MMRDYDEIRANATDRRPFSNGTEGYAWTGNWCDTCYHDRSARIETHPDHPRGCPIFMVALVHNVTPAEWIEQPPSAEGLTTLGDQYHCVEYSPDEDWPDDEPPPQWNPEQPGQLSIFDEMLDQQLPTILASQESART